MTKRTLRTRTVTDESSQQVQGHDQSQPEEPQTEQVMFPGATTGMSEDSEQDIIEDVPSAKKRRGATQMNHIWNMPCGERVVVQFNDLYQPVDQEGRALHSFLGTMARKHNLLTINCESWPKMDDQSKEKCWRIVKSKFLFPTEPPIMTTKVPDYVMRKLGDMWKNYKAELKAKYFDVALPRSAIVAKAPPTLDRAQFEGLVKFWQSDEGKKRSFTNKNNRKGQVDMYTGGSKPIAAYAHDEFKKGKTPTRSSLYPIFRTKKDNTPVTPKVAVNMTEFQNLQDKQVDLEVTQSATSMWSPDDIFSQVMGKERHGRVRGVGFGPTPSMFGSSRKECQMLNTTTEEEAAKDKEFQEMKERLACLEKEVILMKKKESGFHNIEDPTSVDSVDLDSP